MDDLSPAAKAVMDAVEDDCIHPDDKHRIAAAALRAAADQVVPREPAKDPLWASDTYRQRADTRAYLLAIVDELEGAQ